MMKYRPHKGGLIESMALVVKVDGRKGLIAQLREELRNWPSANNFSDDQVRVQAYGGDDERIGWKDVHIVTIDGYGVMGFCEGPAR